MPQTSAKMTADQTDTMIRNAIQGILDLIPDSDHWCRDHMAATASGRERSPYSKDAVRFSLEGALLKAGQILDLTAKDLSKVERYLVKRFGGGEIDMINRYNEHGYIVDRLKSCVQDADIATDR